ncbi:hypothetical protein R3P38DRAFT_2988844 [Favolaschia claudopus]|uniref:Reverse transcriptase n=1 Tax=Favolaschia claudopus TaxID=2862362 RepID=A0AAW0ATW3_9AGAR
MACLDPHLTHGADVIIDTDHTALASLEKIQTMFLRRLLGLGHYSMRAPLFTELGLLPLRFRRLILALRYLSYLITLPHEHYASAALQDAFDLYSQGKQGYWMDLVYALQCLPTPVVLPPLTDLTAGKCAEIGKAIYSSALRYLDSEIAKSTRLYLLQNRLEPLEDEAPKHITLYLRHYLTLVVNESHRKAITRMLTSQHPLAVERMRYKSRYHRNDVPRHLRRCRFGCGAVETVEHALFQCVADGRLEERRQQFYLKVREVEPRVNDITVDNATTVLRALTFNRKTVCQTAKLAHQVFTIFDSAAMIWPDES